MIECLSVVKSMYFSIFMFYCLFSDIDECTNATHNCHDNATCANLDGSFNCTCDPGYMGNGTYCEGNNFIQEKTMRNKTWNVEITHLAIQSVLKNCGECYI